MAFGSWKHIFIYFIMKFYLRNILLWKNNELFDIIFFSMRKDIF